MAILNPQKVSTWNGLTVKEYLLTKNNPNKIDMPNKRTKSLIGITIHNTEWINVSSSTTPAEQYTRATLNGNMGSVVVHYYVDNVCAWQNLPDDWGGWHAADGSGPGNTQTIAIECIMKTSNQNDSVSAKSEDNCAKLAAYLLNKYNLTIDQMYTHQHWYSPKYCPAYILPHWAAFKSKVKSYLDKLKGGSTAVATKPATSTAAPATQMYRIRKSWADAASQIGAYANLDSAKNACKDGYTVYDKDGKAVYTKGAASTATTAKPATTAAPDIFYAVSSGKWTADSKNGADAGKDGTDISCLVAKVSKGTLKYRVHLKGGGWLGWITQYNKNDMAKGYAGLPGQKIDAIEAKLDGVSGYEVKYRVSNGGTSGYLPWVVGLEDYAGIFGKTIDKVQMTIVKK